MADLLLVVNCAGPLILSFLRLPCGSGGPALANSDDHFAQLGLPACMCQLAVPLDATRPSIQPLRQLYELANDMDHNMVLP